MLTVWQAIVFLESQPDQPLDGWASDRNICQIQHRKSSLHMNTAVMMVVMTIMMMTMMR